MFNIIILLFKGIMYIALPSVFLIYQNWFLIWIPFLPVSGSWISSFAMPREYNFIQSYMEFFIIILFLIRWIYSRKDFTSICLIGISLLSIPALVNSEPHFYLSLFLLICLLGGAAVYTFFLNHLEEIMKKNIVDFAVLTWVALGLFVKIYDAIFLDQNILYQRGGDIWGSNHAAAIILLLLSLVKSRFIKILAILFLIFNFSKGIYIALFIYAAFWFLLIKHRKKYGTVLLYFLIFLIIFSLIPSTQKNIIIDYAIERVAKKGLELNQIGVDTIFQRMKEDERRDIFRSAIDISKQTDWIGIGLGGFFWGRESKGYPPEYSNAHNLYLTAIVEGGILFASGIIILLLYFLFHSFRASRLVFIGLLVWIVYGLYSGEIYESSRFVTAGDYYYLMFIFAYVNWTRRRSGSKIRCESARLS